MTRKPVDVVAALICRDGKYMIFQRPETKARGLCWEFPGGKTEPGETPEQALRRECMEELALPVSVRGKVAEICYEYPDLTVHLMLYACTADTDPVLLEHRASALVSADGLDAFPLCPADRILAEELKKLKP